LKIAGRSTQSVGVVRFTATITKLFRGIPGLMSSANTETKKLLILLESFHDDPVFTAFKIFKTISEDIVVRNDLKALLGFTADDFGVVDSV
jgi:hypothetical protein